mgnify:CR=1 FL=1
MYKAIVINLIKKHIVTNNAAQDSLLNIKRKIIAVLAFFHSSYRYLYSKHTKNIYHCSIQKTGSHTIKALFKHPIIRKKTKLFTYPGHRYEWTQFHTYFPKMTFVPALFISKQHYDEIIKPLKYKTFVIVRDPRDVVVSWYYSMLCTHRMAGKVPQHRAVLKKLDKEQGINYAIDELQLKFVFLKSWFISSKYENPDYQIFYFESMKNDFEGFLKKLTHYCDIELKLTELKIIAEDISQAKMREFDDQRPLWLKRSVSNEHSHYRKKQTGWDSEFTKENYAYFKKVNGDILEVLGYK